MGQDQLADKAKDLFKGSQQQLSKTLGTVSEDNDNTGRLKLNFSPGTKSLLCNRINLFATS